MPMDSPLDPEIVLVVDDEEPIRRTFREWLDSARLGLQVLTASDAETALTLANQQNIDLAILDWNLGAGNDGLQLLEDLHVFNPSLVAIMVTGHAHQATPLDAMRKGIRDYLDKNHDLDRNTFLAAVNRQLERIRPARRERRLLEGLTAFRHAVETALPLVQSAAALHDPLSLPDAIAGLFRLLMNLARVSDGVLLVRQYDARRAQPESLRAYSHEGELLDTPLVPFSDSLAGLVACVGESRLMSLPAHGVTLQTFEQGRSSVLAVPLRPTTGWQVVLELLDPGAGLSADDRQRIEMVAELGSQMLAQALSHRQTLDVLGEAVAAALRTSESLHSTMQGATAESPPEQILAQIRQGWADADLAGEDAARLAEAIRGLQVRHGGEALSYCVKLVEGLRRLLDGATGGAEVGS